MKRLKKIGGILCSACRVVLARPQEVAVVEWQRNEGACWCVKHAPTSAKRSMRALVSRDGRLLGVTEALD